MLLLIVFFIVEFILVLKMLTIKGRQYQISNFKGKHNNGFVVQRTLYV